MKENLSKLAHRMIELYGKVSAAFKHFDLRTLGYVTFSDFAYVIDTMKLGFNRDLIILPNGFSVRNHYRKFIHRSILWFIFLPNGFSVRYNNKKSTVLPNNFSIRENNRKSIGNDRTDRFSSRNYRCIRNYKPYSRLSNN